MPLSKSDGGAGMGSSHLRQKVLWCLFSLARVTRDGEAML
jgi:hypothetical protein